VAADKVPITIEFKHKTVLESIRGHVVCGGSWIKLDCSPIGSNLRIKRSLPPTGVILDTPGPGSKSAVPLRVPTIGSMALVNAIALQQPHQKTFSELRPISSTACRYKRQMRTKTGELFEVDHSSKSYLEYCFKL
jgi:hypothetical protein